MKFSFPLQKKFASRGIRTFLERLPYFRGCWLMYCPILSLVPVEKRWVEITGVFTRRYDPADPAQLYMAMNDRFDLGTAYTIWMLLEPGDTFFDIGANFGYFTDIASQKIGEAGKVIAVEPNPSAFATLAKLDQKNILKINKVAGKDSHVRYTMHQPFYRQTTGSQFDLNPNGPMESICLDDLYREHPQVKLVKIDTEGAELFVLEGARKLLAEQRPFVIAEVFGHGEHFDYGSSKIYELMQSLGYGHFYAIDDTAVSITKLDKPAEGQILFSTHPCGIFL